MYFFFFFKEKISSFITSLCLEAVDKIVQILEDAAASPVLKDPPELGRIFKGEMNSSYFVLGLRSSKECIFHVLGGATEKYSTEQTVILVYNKVSGMT